MKTPENMDIDHHKWPPVKEYLKNTAEFLALTAAAYVVLFIGSRLVLPALDNFIRLANSALK